MRIETKSPRETQKVASMLAKKVLSLRRHSAVVIALEGNLGSGKTTFAQGFARALGVREKIQSPTFVLVKIYKLQAKNYKYLIHADCYRINSPKDLPHLGFKNLLKDKPGSNSSAVPPKAGQTRSSRRLLPGKDAIILIEWADRIKKIIPRNAIWLKFSHGKPPTTRIISLR